MTYFEREKQRGHITTGIRDLIDEHHDGNPLPVICEYCHLEIDWQDYDAIDMGLHEDCAERVDEDHIAADDARARVAAIRSAAR